MKKMYNKPIAEIVEFQLKDLIMGDVNPDMGVDGSVGIPEGDGWE